jgi:L-threonylcarbamoyladenylate synthase
LSSFQDDIVRCLTKLREGGVILYPTDTIWGIGCDARNPKALDRISTIKQRDHSKSFIILVERAADALYYTDGSDPFLLPYLESLTEPTTVIYHASTKVSGPILRPDGTVAIRVPQDPFCQQLLSTFQGPLVSTSANLSGEAYPRVFADIDDKIKLSVDYTVRFRQDDIHARKPSALVRWLGEGRVEVIRS